MHGVLRLHGALLQAGMVHGVLLPDAGGFGCKGLPWSMGLCCKVQGLAFMGLQGVAFKTAVVRAR